MERPRDKLESAVNEELDRLRYVQGRLERTKYYLELAKVLESHADESDLQELDCHVKDLQRLRAGFQDEIDLRKEFLLELEKLPREDKENRIAEDGIGMNEIYSLETQAATARKQEERELEQEQKILHAGYPPSFAAAAALETELLPFLYLESLRHKYHVSETAPYECPAGKLRLTFENTLRPSSNIKQHLNGWGNGVL